MVEGTGKGKAGYEKIRFCARQAEHDSLQYFWVDTCCIDKSNNTELSEAINSMFRWYHDATRCYVYLSDVSITDREELAFQKCRWFTRGWTLQELLAPKVVEFFTREGIPIGDKRSLEQKIHKIAGIPVPALQGTPLSQFEVNERFAWAQARETTREEDSAYCLLGIFGVFVPLIYGEGREHAIARLKKEVYNSLSDLHHTNATKVKQNKLIESLKFSSMRERENTITESFVETFQWIFSSDLQPWTNFGEWLKCDAGILPIYWISGKPGSGKSTLMKFIVNDSRTKDLLKPGTLLLRHYLWMPGGEMQRSIKGILCTLLYQLLCTEKSLVGGLLSELNASYSIDSNADWTVPILKRSLIASLRSCPRPVCLFLDGLDEISSADGPHDLLDLIRELSGIAGLKICLASRSDPIFKGEYSRHPNLKLHDLTKRDMRKFCENSIEVLKKNIPDWTAWGSPPMDWGWELTNELVRRADGVFLWLHLALKSICRGLAKSDSWELILQRARGLPADLDQLYQSMWTRANVDRGIYERNAAFYFNLILESGHLTILYRGGCVSAFELIYASESKLQDLILQGEGCLTESKNFFEFGIRKLEAQSAGLIELIPAAHDDTRDGISRHRIYESNEWDDLLPFTNLRVKFIHRTAADFLTGTEQGRAILELDATSRQDKLVALIRAAITKCSMWRRYEPDPFPGELRNFEIFCYTILETPVAEVEKQMLMNQIEREWNRIVKESADSRRGTRSFPDFLGFSASICSSMYVISRLEEIQSTHHKEVSQDYKNYLLQQATRSLTETSWGVHHWDLSLRLSRFLLSQGASSDQATYPCNDIEVWRGYREIPITTPLSNIIQGALCNIRFLFDRDILSHSDHISSELCRTIQLAIQSSDGRDPLVLLPIRFAVDKVRFLHYYQIAPITRLCIILETNTLFLVQLLLDVFKIKHEGAKQSPEFIALQATVQEEFIRNRHISATAKLLSYNHDRRVSGDTYYRVLNTPTSVDPGLIRRKIRGMLRSESDESVKSESDNTEFQRFRRELFNIMHEAAGSKVHASSDSRFWESLKGHRFEDWPPSEEHRRVWPPAMFVENDRLQSAATQLLTAECQDPSSSEHEARNCLNTWCLGSNCLHGLLSIFRRHTK
ncbi:hypothetical protein CJF30_00004429 [Rutstroemia sp. NJR-2017a BBW]|nr:hypothetical protein CJF30_00004429 [Rutstroemia sp. NJR-2017a BBW]